MCDSITNTHRGQRGFTLLEVLIALLILSIGLLGLAALQTIGLRSIQMSFMRTQAAQLAYDISDRMRANGPGPEMAHRLYAIETQTAPVRTANCAMTDCSPADMANFDLVIWRAAVGRLPGGRSRITQSVDAATGIIVHTVTVYWNPTRDPAVTGETCPPVVKTDLRCLQLTV
jgi:type IV pilus assembly protein PilV